MTDSGMLCPKCNSGTTVYDSRPKPNGTTKRYRECLHCGFRFKTIETYNFKSIKNFRTKKIRPKNIKAEDPRKQDMLNLRESGMTYEEIGKKFGLSRQRVHQILKENRDCKIGEYFSQDITFCSKENCKNKKCKRNRCHIDWTIKPYQSFADFENTQYCPQKWIESEVKIK